MTDMKRATISIPADLDNAIYELRKDERFARCSYSEIVRQLLAVGMKASKQKANSKKDTA